MEVILLPPVLSVPKERMQPGVMVTVSGSMKNVLTTGLLECSRLVDRMLFTIFGDYFET